MRAAVRTRGYRVSPEPLFALLRVLSARREIRDSDVPGLLRRKPSGCKEYCDFLTEGRFVLRKKNWLSATARSDYLWEQVGAGNLGGALISFREVASFDRFIRTLVMQSCLTYENVRLAGFGREALRCYAALAEVCGAAIWSGQEGAWATFNHPSPEDFAKQALQCFASLAQGEKLILTGEWLEGMAKKGYGVHPIRARVLLEEARSAGIIFRYLEGASPFAGGRARSMRMLIPEPYPPQIRTVNLYDGTFLVPGIASVHLSLEPG